MGLRSFEPEPQPVRRGWLIFVFAACVTVCKPTWAEEMGVESAPIVGIPTDGVGPVDPAQFQPARGEPLGSPPARGMEFSEATLDKLRQEAVPPGRTTPAETLVPESEAPVLEAALSVTKFEGISATGWIPADPILAVGPQRVIQTVNSSIRISNRTGGAATTATLVALLGKPAGSNGTLFDPWVHYDHFAGRFVLICITTNAARTDSWYIVAVSKNATPTTSPSSWYVYHIRSDMDGSTNTSFWSDYEKVGYDSQYFYITSNQFNSAGTWQYAKIRRYPKSQFYNGQVVSAIEWNGVRNGFAVNGNYYYAFTIQPAVHLDTTGSGYLMSCWNGSGVNRVNIFRISGNLLYTSWVGGWASWTIPNAARQKGSARTVDSGDNRLLGVVYRNRRLYACHAIKTSNFPCAAHYMGINTSNTTRVMETTIGNASIDFYYPALTVTASGNLGTVVNLSGPAYYASSAFTRISANGVIQDNKVVFLQQGLNTYVRTDGANRNRWGDYNGMACDPLNGNQIWFNSMYAKSTVNTWGTTVGTSVLPTTILLPQVQAAFDPLSNSLSITGDEGGDQVLVTRVGKQVCIKGVAGTLVNGQLSAKFDIPEKISLVTNMAGGDDRLSVVGMNLDNVDVTLGDGNDNFWILLSSATNLSADGGDGTDAFSAATSQVQNTHQANIP